MTYVDDVAMAVIGGVATWSGLEFRYRQRANPYSTKQFGPGVPILLITGPVLIVGACAMAAITYLTGSG